MSHVMKYGKYLGKSLTDIFAVDPGYLDWLEKTTKVEGKYAEQNKKVLGEIKEIKFKSYEPTPEQLGQVKTPALKAFVGGVPPSDPNAKLLRDIHAGILEILTILKADKAPDEEIY